MSALVGKRAIVTGGGTGIGRAIALKLLTEGASVTIAGPELDVLETAAHELREVVSDAEILCALCDVTKTDQVEAAMELASAGQGLDIAVANAGGVGSAEAGGTMGPFLYLDENAWRAICDLNIVGTANTIRVAAWKMREKGGSIVATSSAAAVAPETCLSHYSTTKAAVNMMVANAAWELGHFGIRVNALLPGFTLSPSMRAGTSEEAEADLLSRTALGRSASGEEHGELVAFLASDKAAYITGQMIAVDGGLGVQPMAEMTGMARMFRGPAIVDDAFGHRFGKIDPAS